MKHLISLLFGLTISFAGFGQDLKKLDSLLSLEFSQNSKADGRWVYYRDLTNIQKLDKPELSRLLPDIAFYKIMLTNFLGRHINTSACLILFDSAQSNILLSVPLWYSDLNQEFSDLLIGRKYSDTSSLKLIISELQDLLIVGSNFEFENTIYGNDNVTFDLVSKFNGKRNLWRNFKVIVMDNKIQSIEESSSKNKNPTLVK